ncbi:MAG: FtsL-like putative cell division protein [Cytophagaceae bacterium]
MASNEYKQPKEKPVKETKQKSSGKGLFSLLKKYTSIGNAFDDGVPVHYVPYILYVAVLLILYISNAHNGDRLVRKINKMKTEVNDLRADFTTLKADLMLKSKQSEVAKTVAPIGLVESTNPPIKIKLTEEE